MQVGCHYVPATFTDSLWGFLDITQNKPAVHCWKAESKGWNVSNLCVHQSVLILNMSSVQIKFTFSSAILLFCYQAACVTIHAHAHAHTHTHLISKLSSLILISWKTQSYNVKNFQALKLKSKHFSYLENTTFKFKHFHGFQAPVQMLYVISVIYHSDLFYNMVHPWIHYFNWHCCVKHICV